MPLDDATFDALADDHRRRLLCSLFESDSQRVSNATDGPRARPGNGDAIVQNHHIYLLKLADYGFVE